MLQSTKGSPVKPGIQLHTGVWLKMLQTVERPQEPGQGSMHLFLTQALSLVHSELMVHSGRQLGGEPMNVWSQEQEAMPFRS